jgi:hypothetical protein
VGHHPRRDEARKHRAVPRHQRQPLQLKFHRRHPLSAPPSCAPGTAHALPRLLNRRRVTGERHRHLRRRQALARASAEALVKLSAAITSPWQHTGTISPSTITTHHHPHHQHHHQHHHHHHHHHHHQCPYLEASGGGVAGGGLDVVGDPLHAVRRVLADHRQHLLVHLKTRKAGRFVRGAS